MQYPEDVIRYLQDRFIDELQPCCCLVDEEGRLIESWGDTHRFGLGDLKCGADLAGPASFLAGMDLGRTQVIPLVTLPGGVASHIHVVPDERRCYIVLLDASREAESLRREQQAKNEVRLLSASQQRLIMRQRDLISDLVEARAELDHRRRDAERNSASKGRFIAMMSHEFRTPLASIINYAELALEEDVSANDIRKSIEAILRSGRHMTSLVDAVLDDARIDEGQVKISNRVFSLHELIDDLASMIAPLAADKGLSFAAYVDEDVGDSMRADDVCLRQILVNLLGNAVKFTDDGEISMIVSYLDGRLVVSVTDTGPGIGPENQARVFDAFERGDHTADGAGLGLSISLGLAQLMGGEVSLDSALGKGTTVTVHVPVQPGDSQEVSAEAVLPPPVEDNIASRRTSVLVCDDDQDMIALVEFYLHRAGYGLMLAHDGHEVVEKALAYRPDLVLMDVNMPRQTGVEAAKQLRAQGFAAPIVALTAGELTEDDESTFTRAYRKPVPMQELLGQIKALTH